MKYYLITLSFIYFPFAFSQKDSLFIRFGNQYNHVVLGVTVNEHERPKKLDLPHTNYFSPTFYTENEMPAFTINSYINDLQEEPALFYVNDSVAQNDRLSIGQQQEIMDSLLYPFYLSALEVTNREYREFVNWTRDSIARELLIQGTTDLEEKHEMLCNCAESEENKFENGLDFNRDSCKLNWFYEFSYNDPKWVEILSTMYYPEPERYYGRRAMVPEVFNYAISNDLSVNVYPDTSQFAAVELYKGPIPSMYFWHPYYNSYPIVNISFQQMKAFCHWKTKELNKTIKNGRLVVDLPSMVHYEIAAKFAMPLEQEFRIVNVPNDFFVTGKRDYYGQAYHLSKVWRPLHFNEIEDPEEAYYSEIFHRWYHERYNDYFRFLTGNVSEVVLDRISPASLNYYQVDSDYLEGGHFTLGENYVTRVESAQVPSLNTVFFKDILLDGESNCVTGFRLLYRWYPDDNKNQKIK